MAIAEPIIKPSSDILIVPIRNSVSIRCHALAGHRKKENKRGESSVRLMKACIRQMRNCVRLMRDCVKVDLGSRLIVRTTTIFRFCSPRSFLSTGSSIPGTGLGTL
jgi:hypothetical protein